uniref:Ovule protein n=1 Tax=Romanomermis culicivorax TaxID=13658 RepID=A0A915HMB0_ROMCU
YGNSLRINSPSLQKSPSFSSLKSKPDSVFQASKDEKSSIFQKSNLPVLVLRGFPLCIPHSSEFNTHQSVPAFKLKCTSVTDCLSLAI